MQRRRPGAAPGTLRRPAVRREVAPPLPGPDPIAVADKFNRGEEISSAECPLSLLKAGDWIRINKAKYEKADCKVAGKVVRIEVEGTSWEVVLTTTGTDSEELLKVVTALDRPHIRGHLCRVDCDQSRTNANLIHILTLQKIADSSGLTWEVNCELPDELSHLRAAHDQWRGAKKAEKAEGEASSSASRGSKKKKKKAKKKEKKKTRKELSKKMGGRANAQKELAHLFDGTGLDPKPDRRRYLLKRMKKRLKKELPSSSTSSSSSSSNHELEIEVNMLDERSKIQRIAQMAPGVLTAEGLRAMKEMVLQANGTPWALDQDSLPPLVTQYVRQQCLTKASGAMAREMLTHATVCDYLLQGRVAEAIDSAFQRVKALEVQVSGQSWITAQKLEVIPAIDTGLASRAELQVAQRETHLDQKAKGSSTTPDRGDKGKGYGKGKNKDRQKGKDAAKEGGKDGKKRSS